MEVKGKPPAFPKIPMALEKKPKEEKKEKEEETYDKLIEEGYRFQKEEIRETRGNCPFCGGIGNPERYSKITAATLKAIPTCCGS